MMKMLRKFMVRLANTPQFLFHRTFAVFDAWPAARAIDPKWREIPVYCISLKTAARRRGILERQMDRLGFRTFHYVDAPDLSGSTLAELEKEGLYDDAEAMRYHGRSLRLAEISCSLGHGQAYERIAASDDTMALIIEDDALFMSKRFQLLSPEDVPGDFDILFLNSFRNAKRPVDRVRGHVFGTESYKGSTCAYLVSAAAATKLSRAYKPVIHAADGLLGRCMEWPENRRHLFKRQGARTTLRSFMMVPDLVLNGSDTYYYRSILRART